MYLLIAIAAATQPTWISDGGGAGMPLSVETQGLLLEKCFGNDGAAMNAWLGAQTDANNAASPTKNQALGYCYSWATSLGQQANGFSNFAIAPMSQLAIACGMYHCAETFFGFVAADIAGMECVMTYLMPSFAESVTTFPESWGGADTQNYAAASCVCNDELALAAPSPTYPEWLTHTGVTAACTSNINLDPTNAPFFACSIRSCMPDGGMKDYLICTQDEYYGFEGLDACEKLDKLVLGNIAMPVPLAITGVIFFFLAMTMYGIVSICCSSKKNKQAAVGV